MSRSIRADSAPIRVRNLGTADYEEVFGLQHREALRRAEDRIEDQLLLLEHPAVYTAGRRTKDTDRPLDGTPVVEVDRGGEITWHGPGQLVGYPIVKLADPVDVVDYVRRIEQAMIAVCRDLGLVDVGRVEGRSGVWLPAGRREGRSLPERKISAIGIRVAKGVAFHGFSLNCDCDLDAFGAIVPCGIQDAGVTSLTAELGRRVSVDEVRDVARDHVLAALDGHLPVADDVIRRDPPASAPVVTTHHFGRGTPGL